MSWKDEILYIRVMLKLQPHITVTERGKEATYVCPDIKQIR